MRDRVITFVPGIPFFRLRDRLIECWFLAEKGISDRNHHSIRRSFRIPRDHFVPGIRLWSRTNPRKVESFERINAHSARGAVAMARPAGSPHGVGALLRRDSSGSPRSCHAPSACRARHGGPQRWHRRARAERRGVRRARDVRRARRNQGSPRIAAASAAC